jgi:cell division protein FtsW
MSAAVTVTARQNETPRAGVHSTRIVWLVLYLASFGLVLSISAAGGRMVSETEFWQLVVRRGAWWGIGLVLFWLASRIDYHLWRRHSLLIIVAALALLVAVLLPGIGRTVNGARRWIRIGPYLGVQPSEVAKLCLLVWIAAYCERHRDVMKTVTRGFLLPMLVVGLASLLILAEPDFGTAVLVGLVGTLMLLVAGTRLLFVTFGAVAAVPLLHKLILDSPYRVGRILIFLNPWEDPQGRGYQLVQSFIAIGSGGLWGTGLGASTQKLGFLPECSTDFVYAVVAEELGLVGTVALLAVCVWLLMEGLRAAWSSRDAFGFLLATGLTTLLGLQVLINVAVVTGCVPPKGLSLPLISAGGSSLAVTLFGLGILVNIARSAERPDTGTVRAWDVDTPAYELAFGAVVHELGAALSRRLRRWS